MSMLLHLGHGIILSGFFKVFSCEIFISLCSPSLEVFGEVSLSTLTPGDVVRSFKPSDI